MVLDAAPPQAFAPCFNHYVNLAFSVLARLPEFSFRSCPGFALILARCRDYLSRFIRAVHAGVIFQFWQRSLFLYAAYVQFRELLFSSNDSKRRGTVPVLLFLSSPFLLMAAAERI